MAFQFQQFFIDDGASAMKVGTDSVLLGAWAAIHGKTALDIGTGSGLVALMLAQRIPDLHVTGVELDEASHRDAEKNAGNSVFADRVTIVHDSIQKYMLEGNSFDTIVSNPPFFEGGLLPPDKGRRKARHTTDMTHDDLLSAVEALLHPDGLFSVILPASTFTGFDEKANAAGLHLQRWTEVRSRPSSKPVRCLATYGRRLHALERNELYIYASEGSDYHPDFIEWTEGFYLQVVSTSGNGLMHFE